MADMTKLTQALEALRDSVKLALDNGCDANVTINVVVSGGDKTPDAEEPVKSKRPTVAQILMDLANGEFERLDRDHPSYQGYLGVEGVAWIGTYGHQDGGGGAGGDAGHDYTVVVDFQEDDVCFNLEDHWTGALYMTSLSSNCLALVEESFQEVGGHSTPIMPLRK